MNRRTFFVTLTGAAAAAAGISSLEKAEAASFSPLPPTAPGTDVHQAWHRGYPHRRHCRRVWNGYRWVVVCG
jgi:hypothetical protein